MPETRCGGKRIPTARTASRSERGVRNGKISLNESRQLLRFYESGLEGYTYLEEPQQ
jgi:arginine decarboxylase